MNDFVAYTSRGRVLLLIAVSVTFVLFGLWMAGVFGASAELRRPSPIMMVWIGWFNVIFFGLCAGMWIKRLSGKSEQLRIGSSGICSRAWSDDTIPWNEITDVTTWSYNGQRAIVLHLRDPYLFPARGLRTKLASAEFKLTRGDISISLTGTDRSFVEAMIAIDQLSPQKTAKPI